MFEQRIDDLRQQLEQILARPSGWPDESVRVALTRLSGIVEALAAEAGELRTIRERETTQVAEVLDVLFGMAGLDFSKRANVWGDGPLDALAQSTNMLCEEMEAARAAMTVARAAAEAATHAKSRFLAHMSHEIRTPLTALIGFSELLSAPALSESERLNYAMIIRRNGEHLLAVINDILDLSRIEAGRVQLEAIDCSPALILSDVAALMRVRAHDSGLEFNAQLATAIPAVIRSDPTRIRQILLNLVGNAVKFTRKGTVQAVAKVDEPGRLVVEVTDTGIGIAPEQLSALFQPFHQADFSMSRRFGGSGLGLTISRALAEALGGNITVTSEVGRGSTFRLTLPFEPGGEMVSALEDRPSGRPAGSLSPRFSGSVLVVEDGVDNQVLVMTLLRHYGLSVAVVGDGQLAVQRALEKREIGEPYSLILMDMQMPVMDGYQATAALRQAGYEGPILALTAHAMTGERERCLAAGCNDYISKPIDRGQLVKALAQHLPPEPEGRVQEGALYSSFANDSEMEEIIRRFVASLPDRMIDLRVEARSPSPTLLRLVHQLKGAAGGYGFALITDAAAAVQAALADGCEHAVVLRLLDELEAVCARARPGRP